MNLLQLALSRTREFEADRAAALLTGDPLGLASAVSRLDASTGNVARRPHPAGAGTQGAAALDAALPAAGRSAHRAPQRASRCPADAAARHRRGPAHLAGRRRTHRDAPALSLAGRLVLTASPAVVGGRGSRRRLRRPRRLRVSADNGRDDEHPGRGSASTPTRKPPPSCARCAPASGAPSHW